MSGGYCGNCGAELADVASFCSECGKKVGDNSSGRETSRKPETADLDMEQSQTMYQATTGLVAGYFLFVILGVVVSTNALIGIGVVCLFVSIVTMYVDLRDLEGHLWDTRPILWIIGAVLLYIVVAPLYIYKRRQIA